MGTTFLPRRSRLLINYLGTAFLAPMALMVMQLGMHLGDGSTAHDAGVLVALMPLGFLNYWLARWRTALTVDSEGLHISYPFALGRTVHLPWHTLGGLRTDASRQCLYIQQGNEYYPLDPWLWQRPGQPLPSVRLEYMPLYEALASHISLEERPATIDSSSYQNNVILQAVPWLKPALLALPLAIFLLQWLLASDGSWHLFNRGVLFYFGASLILLGSAMCLLRLLRGADTRRIAGIQTGSLIIAGAIAALGWAGCHRLALAAHHTQARVFTLTSSSAGAQTWHGPDRHVEFTVAHFPQEEFVYNKTGSKALLMVVTGPFGIRDILPADVKRVLVRPKTAVAAGAGA